MTIALAIAALVLAAGWMPIAARFNRGWKNRKNPVSLAIFLAIVLFAYTNIIFALALMGQASWLFFGVATLAFDLIVLVNFYVSFYWSDKRFVDQRRDYSIPPTNSSSTLRGP